jgi:hypothetical protein
MAWWNDYDREFDGTRDRGGWMEERSRWDAGPRQDRGYGRSEYFAGRGYDNARDYHRPPHRSPAYGRGGDEQVRRWARRYGYDEGYTIHPRSAGRFGQERLSQQPRPDQPFGQERWSERPRYGWPGPGRDDRNDWGYWW